jgi:hypothetical protein
MNGALLGLATTTNPNRNATELAVYEAMLQRHDLKEQQNIQAQEAEDKVFMQFYEKADKLLGKDKAKISQKFLSYQNQIKQSIKESGMSKADFMKAGGLSTINQIKQDMLTSDEFSTYQINRENATRLMRAMDDPNLRHLVNPNDLKSLTDYDLNPDGGRISYSGLMADVKIPPAANYAMGTQIPLEDIASYDGNMFKILANYAMVYPDNPKPKSEQDIYKFMIRMGYGGTGSSTAMAKARALANRKENQVTVTGELSNAFMNASENLSTTDVISGNKIEQFYNNDLAAKKIIGNNTLGVVGKQIDYDDDGFFKNTFFGNMDDLLGTNTEAIWNRFTENSYGLKNSREIFAFDKEKIGAAILGKEIDNGYVREFKAEGSGWFSASGTPVNSKTFSKNAKDFQIVGISTAVKAKANNGKEFLMMDAYDSNGNIDEKQNKALNEAFKGSGTKNNARLTSVIALKSEDGETVYKEIDMTQPYVQKAIDANVNTNNISDQIREGKAREYLDAQIEYKNKKQKEYAKQQFTQTSGVLAQDPHYNAEAEDYWGSGSAGALNRDKLMSAFYFATNDVANGGAINEEMIKAATESKYFTESMGMAGEEFIDRLGVYTSGNSDEQLVADWFKEVIIGNNIEEGTKDFNTYAEIARKWSETLKLLNNSE